MLRELVNRVGSIIEKQDTSLSNGLRLAITLRYLSTGVQNVQDGFQVRLTILCRSSFLRLRKHLQEYKDEVVIHQEAT